jgi:hypothetical protein
MYCSMGDGVIFKEKLMARHALNLIIFTEPHMRPIQYVAFGAPKRLAAFGPHTVFEANMNTFGIELAPIIT